MGGTCREWLHIIHVSIMIIVLGNVKTMKATTILHMRERPNQTSSIRVFSHTIIVLSELGVVSCHSYHYYLSWHISHCTCILVTFVCSVYYPCDSTRIATDSHAPIQVIWGDNMSTWNLEMTPYWLNIMHRSREVILSDNVQRDSW